MSFSICERDRIEKPVPPEQNQMGLTAGEAAVSSILLDCYQAFLALDRQHPNEVQDFVNAVHSIQGILALRVVRRSYPDGWKTFEQGHVDVTPEG